MAAEKKSQIVIKKIIVAGGGHHGGSWKVALADFMTAMMAFFLVMWLLGQSEETKKAVSDYFSTPSIIEYNYQNFGAEITLEKLFLDLTNEPLKAFQSFLAPADKSPNLLDMGSKKVVTAILADKLGDIAKSVEISQDGFDFIIPDNILFERGTSNPLPSYVSVMDKLVGITTGLSDATVTITSNLFVQSVKDQSSISAKNIASQRLDMIQNKVKASLEHNSVNVEGSAQIKDKQGEIDPNKLIGMIRIKITQHATDSEGKKLRKLDSLGGESESDAQLYDHYINKSQERKKEQKKDRDSARSTFENPVEQSLREEFKF